MTNSHPLDPLTADEIRQAAAILRRERKIGDGWRFASIELKEPAKAVLPGLEAAGQEGGREAIVVCWDRADGQACRATVSLTGDKLTSWENLPGQQPNMTADEWHECDEMLRAQPALVEALARRGITDMSLVLTDMWAYGAALVPERYQRPQDRLVRRLVPGQRAGQPVRAPRHRPAPGRGSEQHDAARAGGQRPG